MGLMDFFVCAFLRPKLGNAGKTRFLTKNTVTKNTHDHNCQNMALTIHQRAHYWVRTMLTYCGTDILKIVTVGPFSYGLILKDFLGSKFSRNESNPNTSFPPFAIQFQNPHNSHGNTHMSNIMKILSKSQSRDCAFGWFRVIPELGSPRMHNRITIVIFFRDWNVNMTLYCILSYIRRVWKTIQNVVQNHFSTF